MGEDTTSALMYNRNLITNRNGPRSSFCWTLGLSAIALSLGCLALFQTLQVRDAQFESHFEITRPSSVSEFASEGTFHECLEHNFDSSSLRNVPQVPASEFLDRRLKLARALHETSTDAFVTEPGYTFYYYANLSQPDWEPWEPEERPFLMIIQPEYNATDGMIEAKTYFLAPSFEVQRVLFSNIASIADSEIIPWKEEENPYDVLAGYMSANLQKPTNETILVVDDELRYFIVRGIEDTGIRVNCLNVPISNVRETKSSTEIAILRAANTATMAGIIAVQKCLIPGLTEKFIAISLNNIYSNHGLTPFFNIVL